MNETSSMAEVGSSCVICKEAETTAKKLVSNPHPDMIADLLNCCQMRLSLGQPEFKELADTLSVLSDEDKIKVRYHSQCRKDLTNKSKIERLKRDH